ncbi:hypothetical protein J4573_29170 [Actinomadura barringtoniae]|uniref:Uncharacterized protein n=1 Tax=Actinomadura barringtoniae TaxID=1427535 RepID=A0A939PEM0_9ACTN|nr:hypothetical protein [Actinomadura barringtoniae]MBO2451196.1 hypothetical protein [Actinomadura barringtoniae]
MKRVITVVATAATLASLPAPAFAGAPELRTVSLPFLWSRSELFEVTPDGAGGVWAGGMQGKYCVRWGDLCPVYSDGNPVVRRRVGSSWQEYPINGWTGQGEIARIASSGGETWIAGGPSASTSSSRYVARFDGSAFQNVTVPTSSINMLATGPAGTFISYWDMDARVLKRTGDAWTAVEVPGFGNINDLQGLTATDVWAVGDREQPQVGSVPAAAHFDGVAWKSVPLPAASGNDRFLKVVPVAANNVWAITEKYLMHWNGSAWSPIAPPAGYADFADLTVDSSDIPWVAPEESASPLKAPYRYSGGKWEAVTVPTGIEVHDLATVSGVIWGVGRQGDGAAAVNGS